MTICYLMTRKLQENTLKIQQPKLHHEIVFEIIFQSIDLTEDVENSLVLLLHALLEDKIVSLNNF